MTAVATSQSNLIPCREPLFAAALFEATRMDYPTYLPYVLAWGPSILDTLAYLSPCNVFSLARYWRIACLIMQRPMSRF